MRNFNYLYYTTSLNEKAKFASRSIPLIFLGYSSTRKGYRCLSISSKTFCYNHNVLFHDYIFPFVNALQ